jgi:hypothetical protein
MCLSGVLGESGKRAMRLKNWAGNVGASEILYVWRSLITPCHASDGCFDTSPSEVHRLGQVM